MEKNQKINCTVESCIYNKNKESLCSLEQILVSPIKGVDTKLPDESMCSSYRNKQKIQSHDIMLDSKKGEKNVM